MLPIGSIPLMQRNSMQKDKETIRSAFFHALPIICSYLFISVAYGMTMQAGGFAWYISALVSLLVYTGAYQFVLVMFLSGGASLVTVALTALLMNSRQSFYSLTFLNDFSRMGRRRLYMIHSMTDETFAVNCSLSLPQREKEDTMFYVAIFSQASWVLGTAVGGALGALIPFTLEGVDFCMTAMFTVIFMDQWKGAKDHTPALTGLALGTLCLIVFGANSFMLPALLAVSAVLAAWKREKVDA